MKKQYLITLVLQWQDVTIKSLQVRQNDNNFSKIDDQMEKIMPQDISFVPGFSGECTLPSFSDLTASKQAFICNKGLLLPEQIVSGIFLFFQVVRNIHNGMCCVQKNIVSRLIADKGIFLPLSAFCVYMKYGLPQNSVEN